MLSKREAKIVAALATCFQAGFLFILIFEPEDGGDIFLPALYTRRWYSS
jgi:hypothetical protein